MKKYYYTIGEVSNLLNIKPYVIRYWETEFPQLKPRKGLHRNRQFTQEHIDLLMRIKDMLYNQKFTIDGARKKLKQMRKAPEQIAIFGTEFSEPTHNQQSNSAKSQLIANIGAIKESIIKFRQTILIDIVKNPDINQFDDTNTSGSASNKEFPSKQREQGEFS